MLQRYVIPEKATTVQVSDAIQPYQHEPTICSVPGLDLYDVDNGTLQWRELMTGWSVRQMMYGSKEHRDWVTSGAIDEYELLGMYRDKRRGALPLETLRVIRPHDSWFWVHRYGTSVIHVMRYLQQWV